MTMCSGHFMKIRFRGIRCRKLKQLIVALSRSCHRKWRERSLALPPRAFSRLVKGWSFPRRAVYDLNMSHRRTNQTKPEVRVNTLYEGHSLTRSQSSSMSPAASRSCSLIQHHHAAELTTGMRCTFLRNCRARCMICTFGNRKNGNLTRSGVDQTRIVADQASFLSVSFTKRPRNAFLAWTGSSHMMRSQGSDIPTEKAVW